MLRLITRARMRALEEELERESTARAAAEQEGADRRAELEELGRTALGGAESTPASMWRHVALVLLGAALEARRTHAPVLGDDLHALALRTYATAKETERPQGVSA